MRVPLSWLREFIDVPVDVSRFVSTLDDLGLVVEEVEHVGEGLNDIIVARVDEIHAIEGADRIRRVIADAGEGPVEIVCGAMNVEVGNHVPFAPVGAVLPGDFVITTRTMRGVTSHGMLCSGRELGLSDDHAGLMILDGYPGIAAGQSLLDVLGVSADIVLHIAPEGNRPDAWSIEGVARDVAARYELTVRAQAVATPTGETASSLGTSASIDAPELCGSLTVARVRQVTVTDSPPWLRNRLSAAGMRAVNNVVDASNYVMLELGQPTHPYDAALVAGTHLGVRRAEPGESLTTLDGVVRTLGQPGRGLGDTGIDCVIVDGADTVIGLAGIMGGATSVISSTTTDVLLEAAYFDPMTIARTSKRLGLRSEASNRFERGVDPTLASRALSRFVELLTYTSPDLQWSREPIVVEGHLPVRPVIDVSARDVEKLLGTPISVERAAPLLRALGFEVVVAGDVMTVTPPPARLDVRSNAAGRADVIEEIARLYSYQRLERRTPTWTAPGGLTDRQVFRRLVRDSVVGLGLLEAWTASFVSDEDFDAVAETPLRVRVTNPLNSEESVLRSSMLVGLARAWGKNVERGTGDVGLFELGTVVDHPGFGPEPRRSRGGAGGTEKIELPTEHETLMVLLGRHDDDARSAVATWHALAQRWGLRDVVVRTANARPGWHPTRSAELVDRSTGARVGFVGEIDPALVSVWAPAARAGQRVGLVEINLDVASDPTLVLRRDATVRIPSRFPSAVIDLAFVTPDAISASDLGEQLRATDPLVESVHLFDVYRGEGLEPATRSLAFTVRLSADDRTLSDTDVTASRERLIERAGALGARLR